MLLQTDLLLTTELHCSFIRQKQSYRTPTSDKVSEQNKIPNSTIWWMSWLLLFNNYGHVQGEHAPPWVRLLVCPSMKLLPLFNIVCASAPIEKSRAFLCKSPNPIVDLFNIHQLKYSIFLHGIYSLLLKK